MARLSGGGLLISVSPGPGAVASMSSGAKCISRGYWTALGLQGGLVFRGIALGGVRDRRSLLGGLGAGLSWRSNGWARLIWRLGLNLVFRRPLDGALAAVASDRPGAQIRRGFLVNLSNPKAIGLFSQAKRNFSIRAPSVAAVWRDGRHHGRNGSGGDGGLHGAGRVVAHVVFRSAAPAFLTWPSASSFWARPFCSRCTGGAGDLLRIPAIASIRFLLYVKAMKERFNRP